MTPEQLKAAIAVHIIECEYDMCPMCNAVTLGIEMQKSECVARNRFPLHTLS